MAKVIIYTADYCNLCGAAKHLLESKGATVQEIDVDEDCGTRDWLVKTTGQRTVPQIFIDDQSIGGFSELRELDSEGKLDEILGKKN